MGPDQHVSLVQSGQQQGNNEIRFLWLFTYLFLMEIRIFLNGEE